jgi:hypothetical protein
MAKRHAFRFLCPLMLYFFSTMATSAADAWQEDFRRCRVLKQFSQGSVIILAGEIDIQRRLTPSCRHQLSPIALPASSSGVDKLCEAWAGWHRSFWRLPAEIGFGVLVNVTR